VKKIRIMIYKEFRQTFRNKQSLAIMFILPVIQLLIIGSAISTEVSNIALGVVDYDGSSMSREIADAFAVSEQFTVIDRFNSIEMGKESIQKWQTQALLVIPADFSERITRGQHAEIGLFLDGLDGNTAGISAGYAAGIINKKAQDLMGRASGKISLNAERSGVKIIHRYWYNPDLKADQYMIPGLVGVIMTVLSLMLSSMSLVRERELGTLEQLVVTPLKKHELLLGKLLPFLIMSIASMLLTMFAAQQIFSIRMMGSYLVLVFCSLVFLTVTLSMGIFVSTLAATQQQAMFISWFVMVFMILLSGIFVSVDNMPEIIKKFTLLNPMRYFVQILRDVFQKGSSLRYLYKDVLSLFVLGISMFAFSYLKFSKKVG